MNGKATPPAVGRLGLEGLGDTVLVFGDSSSGEGGSDVMVGISRWLRSPDVVSSGLLLLSLAFCVDDVSSSLALLFLLLVCPASVTVRRRDLGWFCPCCFLLLGNLAFVPSVSVVVFAEGSLSAFSSRVIYHASAKEGFEMHTSILQCPHHESSPTNSTGSYPNSSTSSLPLASSDLYAQRELLAEVLHRYQSSDSPLPSL